MTGGGLLGVVLRPGMHNVNARGVRWVAADCVAAALRQGGSPLRSAAQRSTRLSHQTHHTPPPPPPPQLPTSSPAQLTNHPFSTCRPHCV